MLTNLEKIAGAIGSIARSITEPAGNMAASHVRELGALGALAVPSAYNAVSDKKMGKKTTAALEVGGLGALAAPYAYKLIKGH
jgi:hypothetical protein